jgi:hypothetical protein
MERSRFPYTARSSAKVIRHAVSIDERRAKFRQDLMYQSAKADAAKRADRGHHGGGEKEQSKSSGTTVVDGSGSGNGNRNDTKRGDTNDNTNGNSLEAYRYTANKSTGNRGRGRDPNRNLTVPGAGGEDAEEVRYRPRSRSTRATRSRSRVSETTSHAGPPTDHYAADSDSEDEDETAQDIDEVWFAGGHGDVGGGWEIPPDGKSASHVPLAWMVHEAMRAGLSFDMEKLVAMGCAQHEDDLEEVDGEGEKDQPNSGDASVDKEDANNHIPDIMIRSPSASSPTMLSKQPANHHPFHHLMHKAHTALIHDSLSFSSNLGYPAVLAWRIMEYLPFRRMDLQHDGSWKPIRWPLPCGEVRDVPRDVRVHGSVIRRMQADENYRPGNLIMLGGGRGRRKAPPEMGMGLWTCVAGHGDPVGEVWMRREVVGDGHGDM